MSKSRSSPAVIDIEEQRKRIKKVEQLQKENSEKNKFIRLRMWTGILIAKFFPDRGVIPRNIGNNIYIGNNQYITKNSISSIIYIKEFSLDTPIAFISKMVRALKTKCRNTHVNVTILQNNYSPKIHDAAVEARVRQWEITMDNPAVREGAKERVARLLYSYEKAKSGETCYRSHVYITLRAQTGTELKSLENEAKSYLSTYNIEYTLVKSDIEMHLKYMSLLSSKREEKIKDIPQNILTAETLAEILPTTQGLNDIKGSFKGINRLNQNPYFIDDRTSSNAKNYYIVSESGSGKTFLVQNWLLDDFTMGWNCVILDIKGTEFRTFTKATGGLEISMNNKSTEYINTFRLNPSTKEDYSTYFNSQLKLSKMLLLYLANLSDDLISEAEGFLEEFLRAVYLKLGVVPGNIKTWERTRNLNPYAIYDLFMNYISKDVREKYSNIIPRMISRYNIYLNRDGTESGMFKAEYNMQDILSQRVITFNFGLLNTNRVEDKALFNIKALFMSVINNEFTNYKKSLGQWTVKVLEEHQVAGEGLLQIYKEEVTLRRSQNQKTYLLGNSVSALFTSSQGRPIIENMNVLCIGNIGKSSKELLVKEYNLEYLEDKLDSIADDPKMENTFLLVNRMQRNSTYALLKAFVPEEVIHGELFKNVDVEK